MIRFALDLELEQFPRNTEYENRIIQLGAVKFNVKSGEILDELCIYFNMDKPISDYINKLTGITDQDLAGGTDILSGYRQLREWTKGCGSHQAVVWGSGDMRALKNNLKLAAPNEPWVFGHRETDVKCIYQTYANAKNIRMVGGLKRSLQRCFLTFEGKPHNAVDDAKNTAKFYCWFVDKFKKL